MSIVMGITVVVQLTISKLGDMASMLRSHYMLWARCAWVWRHHLIQKISLSSILSPVGGLLQDQGRVECSRQLQRVLQALVGSQCSHSKNLNLNAAAWLQYVAVAYLKTCVYVKLILLQCNKMICATQLSNNQNLYQK